MRPFALTMFGTLWSVLGHPASAQTLSDPAPIVSKLQEKLQSAKSLSIETEMRSTSGPPLRFKVRALRPNYYRVEGEKQSFFSDGKAAWQFFPLLGQYGPFMFSQGGMNIPMAQGFEFFSPPKDYKGTFARAEETTFEGKPAIALIQEPKEVPTLQLKTFVDPKTWLPVGFEQVMNGKSSVMVYRNIRTEVAMSPDAFAWTPPKGTVDMRTVKRDGPKPLEAGETAPTSTLTLTNGRTLAIPGVLKGKKALLVNFWFINCGYCLLELPELATLYKELRAEGLEVVAVNDLDDLPEVRAFLRKTEYPFPVAVDADATVAKAFRVHDWGHPVTFLIGPDGKIAYTQIGYDVTNKLAELRKALQKLGVGSRTE
jgi:peroxiredoxin/outer membrane lipoprotein-sorting protein